MQQRDCRKWYPPYFFPFKINDQLIRGAALCAFLWGILFLLPVQGQSVQVDAAADVNRLTSPEMFGRGYTHMGHQLAAEFIKERFKEIGLESRYSDRHFQEFKVKINRFSKEPRLTVNGTALKPGLDFLPHPMSGGGDAEAPKDPLIWVDHGLIIAEKQINDFANHDVKKAVVLMDGKIPEYVKSMRSLQGNNYSLEARAGMARVFEAKGVIALVDKLTFAQRETNIKMPIIQVLRDRMPANPMAVKTVSYDIDAKVKRVKTNNVIGFLEAREPTEDMIILTAHYDHLGSLGKSVYFPGANDNASGVAMLFSLAEYFKTHRLQCNILFVAFSGEELGLKGSAHFVKKLPVDPKHVKFVLNFDMVASGENGIVALGGSDFPDDYNKLQNINQQLGLGPLKERKNKAISDQYHFIERGIKGFYLYTKDGKQPYHHINDLPASLEWEDYMHVYELSRSFISLWE